MSSPKTIAIRIGGLLFAIFVGVPWMVLTCLPFLIWTLVGKEENVEKAADWWMWPFFFANEWLGHEDT